MPRALSIKRAIVPAGDRAKYIERLKVRKAHYEKSNCKFWVFEELSLAGAFIEFTESTEAAVLTAAHVSSPEQVLDPARVYTELELS